MSTIVFSASTLVDIFKATDQDRASAALQHVCVRTDPDSLAVSLIATDGKILLIEVIGTSSDYWPDFTISPQAMSEILGKGKVASKASTVTIDLDGALIRHTKPATKTKPSAIYEAKLGNVQYPSIPTSYLRADGAPLVRSSVLADASAHCVGSQKHRGVVVFYNENGAIMGRGYVGGGQVEAQITGCDWPANLGFNADYMAQASSWCNGVMAHHMKDHRCIVCRDGDRFALIMTIAMVCDHIPQPRVVTFTA